MLFPVRPSRAAAPRRAGATHTEKEESVGEGTKSGGRGSEGVERELWRGRQAGRQACSTDLAMAEHALAQ